MQQRRSVKCTGYVSVFFFLSVVYSRFIFRREKLPKIFHFITRVVCTAAAAITPGVVAGRGSGGPVK